MLQLFQTKDGPFFFIVTLVYTCRTFFAVSWENIYPIYYFGHSSSQSVSQWNSFSPLKYIVYKCYSCFRPRMGHFFSSSHLSTLVALFLLYHQKIFIPYIVLVTVRLSLFLQWNSFSPLKYIVYKCYSCFRPGMGHFFHRHTCLHLSRFFCCIIKKYLSHILFWSQFVSVCFAMKFIFSFKIHCLQMLVVSDQGWANFFSSSHLSRFFLLYHQKIFIPYIALVTVRLSLFCSDVHFLL